MRQTTPTARPRVLVCDDLADSYSQAVVRSLLRYATLRTRWVLNLVTFESKLPLAIRDFRPQGLLVRVSPHSKLEGLIDPVRIPVVQYNWVAPVPLWPTVAPDNRAAGQLAAHHLLERGFRRFGFYGLGESAGPLRLEGFRQAVEKAGGACDVFPDRRRPPSHRDRMRSLLRWLRGLSKPSGICVVRDGLGAFVIEACQQLGLRVPDEVAVIAIGDDDLRCHLLWPSLSSVRLDPVRIGQAAAIMLERLMAGKPVPARHRLVAPLGVANRQSTDTFAVDDQDIREALRFMREHDATALYVDGVARHVGLSRRSFERRLRAALGCSPNQAIQQARIERAKNMLAETDLKISAVAEACGFGRLQDLWLLFHKLTGLSPREFRQQQRPSSVR